MYEQIGVHVMQSQPLHRTHFSQYQASSPALGITLESVKRVIFFDACICVAFHIHATCNAAA